MTTLTLASIYESQGYKREALEIYWKILEKDPSNRAALKGLDRLSNFRRVFNNPNKKMTQKFIYMSSKEEYREFERWLLEC
jgi:hypothetical protein